MVVLLSTSNPIPHQVLAKTHTQTHRDNTHTDEVLQIVISNLLVISDRGSQIVIASPKALCKDVVGIMTARVSHKTRNPRKRKVAEK